MKITDLDKKILFELDQDGRASYSAIAKNAGTTPQVVKYRFERLMDGGAIKHFWAFVDYDRVGYPVFPAYWLKFGGITEKEEEDMFSFFRDHEDIPIVMRSDGYADAMLAPISQNVYEHNELIQNTIERYSKHLVMNEVINAIAFIKFPRKFLAPEKSEKPIIPAQSGGHTRVAKLSILDRKIISLLQIDGRMRYSEMARRLGRSVSVVQKHHRKLLDEGVITKTTFTFNHEVVGLRLYRVLFKISFFDQSKVDELYAFCQKHPNVVNFLKAIGYWQLMLDIEIPNRAGLRKLLREIRHEFKDIVVRVEVNEIYKIDKFTQMKIEYPELADK